MERPHSRRHGPERRYVVDPHRDARPRPPSPPGPHDLLERSGRLLSSFHRILKRENIDPKLARLMLLYADDRPLRPREVAWRLGISRATASRLLDRAERAGLVDKLYWNEIDGRATHSQPTRKGRAFHDRVRALCERAAADGTPRFGAAYGHRAWRRVYYD
jgi:DNA-binding MarR family transcriptional regulator